MLKVVRRYVCHSIAIAALIGAAAGGCGSSSNSVTGDGHGVNRATHALTTGSLTFANGTYGVGCVSRSGAWSVHIDGNVATTDNPLLTVVKNNTACVLSLTSLATVSGTYVAAPTIVLSDSFPVSASAFALPASPTAFYANARLTAVNFADNFTILIPFSDDPRLVAATNTADFVITTSSGSSSMVVAPNYTISLAGLMVGTDASNVVQSATGTANLTDGSQTGEGYIVLAASPGASYAEIHAAYTAATPTAISGPNPMIPASAFTLVGVNLTSSATRYLIIAHSATGESSYELITVTFDPHG